MYSYIIYIDVGWQAEILRYALYSFFHGTYNMTGVMDLRSLWSFLEALIGVMPDNGMFLQVCVGFGRSGHIGIEYG